MKKGLFSAFFGLRFRRDRRVSEDEGELESQLSETLAEVLGLFAELDELAAEELWQVAPVKNVPEGLTVENQQWWPSETSVESRKAKTELTCLPSCTQRRRIPAPHLD